MNLIVPDTFIQITRHWVYKVKIMDTLKSGKVYYTAPEGGKVMVANKEEFFQAAPDEFDFHSGNLYHLKDPRPIP